MPERDLSPAPDAPRPQAAGHHRTEDDIELPPVPDMESDDTTSWPAQPASSGKSGGLLKLLGGVILLGAIVGGGLFLLQGPAAEKQHPNWEHVSAAAEGGQLVHIDAAGMSQQTPSVEVTVADADRQATQQVRAALMRNDVAAATAALQAAQQFGQVTDADVQSPELTADSELALAIQDGRKELFQIELFDCCDEDGDIVEVLVNGASFATVPISHSSSTLSIPLERGNNTVTIRGVKDGGGGVTVSFRTSRGDFFARYMDVGEEHQIGVVVQ